MRKLFLLFVLSITFVSFVSAQGFYSRRVTRNWRFSYGLGSTTYHGDMNDLFFDKIGGTLGFNVGIGLRRTLGSAMSLSLNLNYYNINASDNKNGTLQGRSPNQRTGSRSGQMDSRFVRNLSFEATNFEGSVRAQFNLIPENRGSYRRPLLNPFLFIGIGFSTNNPMATHPVEGKVNLRHLNTEALPGKGYSSIVLVMPIGFGLRVKAGPFIDFIFESGWRFTNSDYLDDVSGFYPSRDALIQADRQGSIEQALIFFDRSEEGGFPERQEGNIRGNPDRNDAYYMFQVSLELYLPNGLFENVLFKKHLKPKFR